MNRKECAVAAFLDMEKAFDRVWHEGLLYKLANNATPRRLIHVVASFLKNRSFTVRIDSAISTPRAIRAGVPQGSCLSPALYSVYTDDIPIETSSTLALYADDIAIITSSIRSKHAVTKLQRSLNLLPDWLAKWRMRVNVSKTQCLVTGRYQLDRLPKLTLENQDTEWTKAAKYLGVTIDRDLNMYQHVKNTTAATNAAISQLRPVFRSPLPLKTKVNLVKAYIVPRLTYAAPAWFNLTSELSKKRLRKQLNKALRQATQAPRFVRNATIMRDLRFESLDDFNRRLTKKMFERADDSTHAHVRDIAPWHTRPPDRRALPRDCL